ncbi:hypothetical protein B8P98_13650 [Klebsiella quasivariicola]|nr:hypothetical protein B8P98_13650 [Klebsiella quasivariicola]
MFSGSTRMPSIETFMTFLLALTLLEISPGPDMMLTIATRSGRSDDWGSPVISSRILTSEIHSFMPRLLILQRNW